MYKASFTGKTKGNCFFGGSFMREEKYTAIKWICGMGRLFSLLLLLSAFALGVSQLNIFLGLSGEEEAPKAVFAAALSSRQLDRGLFGNIRIESQEQVSLSRAFLLINGEQCGDFSQGQLSVRVYPGDVLRVDASAYQRELYFSIVESSPSIRSELLAESLCCRGDIQEFGEVQFK